MNSIPWYKSPVFVGIVVAIVSKAATFFGLADKFGADAISGFVNDALDLVAVLALAFAGWKRARSPIQPLALTKATADTPAAKSHALISAFLLIVASTMLSGCPAALAVKEAKTTEQRAGALIGDFTIFQRAALEIGNDASVPLEIRTKVVAAPIAVKPAVDHLIELLVSYRTIESELAAGTSTDEKLQIAATNLATWIVDLTPKIAALRQTIEESRK